MAWSRRGNAKKWSSAFASAAVIFGSSSEDVKSGTLQHYIRENVSEDVEVIVTDDFSSYPFAMKRPPFRRQA